MESYQFLSNYFLNSLEYQVQINYLFQIFVVKCLLTCKTPAQFKSERQLLLRQNIIINFVWLFTSLGGGIFFTLRAFYFVDMMSNKYPPCLYMFTVIMSIRILTLVLMAVKVFEGLLFFLKLMIQKQY